MNTDQLVSVLAFDDTPPRPISPRVMGMSGLWLLAAAAIALLILGVRDDLLQAMTAPVTAMKWLLPLGIAIPALLAAIALSRPVTWRVPILWMALAVGMGAVLWLLLSIMGTPADQLMPDMWGNSRFVCLTAIVGISILPLGTALWVLQDGASPAPGLSGACTGLAVGGFAAAVYALHCNEDEPLFFLIWYSLGILIVAALGAIAGRSLLRW
ncbi:NrsF family protein [Paracoccus onubensis]|nr:DUF1109 domain-containing protein [Paracoccus onubensis]